jgi:lysine biosynthesis protein LysW
MAKVKTKVITAFCPTCDTRIRFSERPRLFDIVSCPECEEFFEVVRLSPIELQWADESSLGDEELEDGDDWW